MAEDHRRAPAGQAGFASGLEPGAFRTLRALLGTRQEGDRILLCFIGMSSAQVTFPRCTGVSRPRSGGVLPTKRSVGGPCQPTPVPLAALQLALGSLLGFIGPRDSDRFEAPLRAKARRGAGLCWKSHPGEPAGLLRPEAGPFLYESSDSEPERPLFWPRVGRIEHSWLVHEQRGELGAGKGFGRDLLPFWRIRARNALEVGKIGPGMGNSSSFSIRRPGGPTTRGPGLRARSARSGPGRPRVRARTRPSRRHPPPSR